MRIPRSSFTDRARVGRHCATEICAAFGVGLAAREHALPLVADLEAAHVALGVVRAREEAGFILAARSAVAKEEGALAVARAPRLRAASRLAGVEKRALLVRGAARVASSCDAPLRASAVSMLPALCTSL